MKYHSKLQKGFVGMIAALIVGALAVCTGAVIQSIVNPPKTVIKTIETVKTVEAPKTTTNEDVKVGSINYLTGGGTYRLQSSIGTTDTTIRLSSFKEPVSQTSYTMAYMNTSLVYGTLDPQNSTRSEFISFTGITQNADGTATLTGVTRGLSRSYPYTTSSTFKQTHSGQSIFILSNTPQVYNDIYTYINNASYNGAVAASPSILGLVQTATGAQAAANQQPTTVGATTTYYALTSDIASSTRSANTRQVVVASSTGYIDDSFISTSTLSSQFTPTGSITAYASTTAPSGWLLANGSSVLRETYPALFAVIGVSYGSVDGTHFTLPDLRGRNILMASTSANMAQIGGESSHILTVNELASHAHSLSSYYSPPGGTNVNYTTGGSMSSITSTNSTGGDAPHNVLDPYLVLNYIIKY